MIQTGSNRKTYAVLSHISGVNQGDDLVVHTTLQALRQRSPNCEFILISMYPPDSESRHGVPAIRIGARPIDGTADAVARPRWLASVAPGLRLPGARILRRARNIWYELPAGIAAVKALRSTRLLIIAGSGPLEDDPGSAFRILKWSVLARLAGARVSFASVGAGPLESRLNQLLVRAALKLSDYATVRDESSRAVLRDIGHRGPLAVMPDMAFGFPRSELPALDRSTSSAPTIGLNVMSTAAARLARGITVAPGEADRFNRYIDKMLTVTKCLAEKGATIVLFSSEFHHDIELRNDFVHQFAERWPSLAGRLRPQLDRPTREQSLLDTLAECDAVIATRFHSILLPLVIGKPTIGLAYHPKTTDLMSSLGLSHYMFSVDSFNASELVDKVDTILLQDSSGHSAIRERIESFRCRVEAQFDLLAQI